MTMRIGTAARTAAVLALVLLGVWAASAADLELQVGERVVLSNPEDAGECRLLLALDRPPQLERAVILLATLRVELPHAARIGELPPVEVFFCEREWPEGLVSWDEGWESGDGVWDESWGALVDVQRAGDGLLLTADVTGVLRAALRASAEEPALILVPWSSVPGLPAALPECSASIEVEWMPAEPVRRNQH